MTDYPLYWLLGTEPVQVYQKKLEVRNICKRKGYTSSVSYVVQSLQELQDLIADNSNLGIFQEKSCLTIELKLGFNLTGEALLYEFLCNNDAGHAILLIMNKMPSKFNFASLKTLLEKKAKKFTISNVAPYNFEKFAISQIQKFKLNLTPSMQQMVIKTCFNNPVSLVNTLKILRINFGAQEIGPDLGKGFLEEATSINMYMLLEAALAGNSKQVVFCINKLKATNFEPLVLLYGLRKDIFTLIKIHQITATETLAAACQKLQIWQSKQKLYQKASKRISVDILQNMLQTCDMVEMMIKGLKIGNPYELLTDIAVQLSLNPKIQQEESILCQKVMSTSH